MSIFSHNINSVDRLNQATTLLGGATAQSHSAANGILAPQFLGLENLSLDWYISDVKESNVSRSLDLDKLLPNISQFEYPKFTFNESSAQQTFFETQSKLSILINDETEPDSDLLSRFQEFDEVTVSVGNTGAFNQQDVAAGQLTQEAIGKDFLLSSFLAEIIEQAQKSRAEFDGAFDGDRQGAIREFLDSTGAALGTETRGILQDNFAGVGRGAADFALETLGIDLFDPLTNPLLATDYYGESAALINNLLDVLVQPIGSLSLPEIGPLIGNSRDELLGTLG